MPAKGKVDSVSRLEAWFWFALVTRRDISGSVPASSLRLAKPSGLLLLTPCFCQGLESISSLSMEPYGAESPHLTHRFISRDYAAYH